MSLLNLGRGDLIPKIEEHLHLQDTQLGRIEARVVETNGRVTELEKERAVREALETSERAEVAKRLKARDRWWWVVGGIGTAAAGSGVGTFVYVVLLHAR